MNDQLLFGSYIPTTSVWDISTEIQSINADPQLKELLLRLYQNLNLMALVINTKATGMYPLQEFVTGAQYFSRQTPPSADNQPGEFRFTYYAPSLAAGATSIPLPFTVIDGYLFKLISGAATNTTTGNHYPLPFAGAAGNNIELRVTNTTIEINNASGQVFTGLMIVLEYVKST